MELVIKHFKELTTDELFEIYKLRTAVFVVEQNCPYQEVDDADRVAYHLYLRDEDGIAAYLRVLPQGVAHEAAAIGRVISVKRRMGLGTKIVEAGIAAAKEKFHADCIEIGAQTYVRKLYENVGFIQSGPEYVEDGIPHIPMILKFDP